MPPPSKRRKPNNPTVEEIVFDTSARQEYLTGFHKRKLQRAKHAQELAEKKAKEEKITERRRIRKERKEELEAHVQAMKAAIPKEEETATEDDSEDESEGVGLAKEWNGIPDLPTISTNVAQEAEYIDEEKYTTVTVEPMDVSKEGIYKASMVEENNHQTASPQEQSPADQTNGAPKRAWTKEKPKTDRPKKKKRKFRYESKADRKASRLKEKSGNKKKARARRSE